MRFGKEETGSEEKRLHEQRGLVPPRPVLTRLRRPLFFRLAGKEGGEKADRGIKKPPLLGEVARRSRDGEVVTNLRQPLSQPAADSIPTPFVPSGHFPLIGGIGPWKGSLCPLRRGNLSGAARQLPFARGAKGLTGISFCSSCRRKKEGTLFWQFMGRMM